MRGKCCIQKSLKFKKLTSSVWCSSLLTYFDNFYHRNHKCQEWKEEKKTVKIKIQKLGHQPLFDLLIQHKGSKWCRHPNFEFKSDFDMLFFFRFLVMKFSAFDLLCKATAGCSSLYIIALSVAIEFVFVQKSYMHVLVLQLSTGLYKYYIHNQLLCKNQFLLNNQIQMYNNIKILPMKTIEGCSSLAKANMALTNFSPSPTCKIQV